MTSTRSPIPLAVVGCDFRVASSRWRSRLVLDRADALHIAGDLASSGASDGFLDLNTCNRNEWIASSQNPCWVAELLRSQMKMRLGPEALRLIEPYKLVGEEAARHVFRVAIGQKSLVVGERQIAGQLFRALEEARSRSTSSRILNGMGSIAGRLVRTAIRRGTLACAATGVHSLAVSYLRQRFAGKKGVMVAVIGLGSIGRRIQSILQSDPAFLVVPCNRTVSGEETPRVRPLDELAQVLKGVDAAIVCTGAPEPVFGPEHVSDRPLLVVDIGIPEQVHRIGLPRCVEVVGLDELTTFHGTAGSSQGPIAEKEAEELVERAVVEFKVFCCGPVFSEILDTVQKHHREQVIEEVARLVAGRLDYLQGFDKERLEQDIRNIVLEYTNEVFRTIKETSRRWVEGSK